MLIDVASSIARLEITKIVSLEFLTEM